MVTAPSDTNRPYASPANLISVLHRFRSRKLPEVVDIEYLRDAGIPEGSLGRVLFAIRYLGLVSDGGEPSQALRSVHTSTDEEYKEILAGLIRQAYSDVFGLVDPAEDTQDRILNVFRRYSPASQRERMVSFFLGMAREAGIPTLDAPRQRSMGGSAGRQVARPPTNRPGSTAPRGREQGRGDRLGVHYEPGLRIAPALEGLIRSLPDPGTALSLERRTQWIKMAEATLAFLYPDMGEGPEEQEDAEPPGQEAG